MTIKKPKTDVVVRLSGENGNTVNLAGIVANELKRNGYRDLGKEVFERLGEQKSQDDAIQMFMEYVEIE
ncbi:hypothetical protein BUZ69_10785 [Staphylococcus saprophyticus]|uniref:hypothetical protein n=1 Tax=Staphylococcus saprophyticus TaxID=29385 RepID=UPI000D1F89AC|nr:hypothetical protein [Staphylococcus saprophyticus]PTK45336.1 hypothetical protein BUZ69_10785 [Staphylococcus saprophyticus]